jgi:hypothetical protein
VLHFDDLLPAADHIAVESLRITPTMIVVKIRCTDVSTCCPIYKTASRRVRSKHVRVLLDLPRGGIPIVLRLMTRL